MSADRYLERNVKVNGREFAIRIILFANGGFVSISEGSTHRIGALNVSLPGAGGVTTAKVIPSKQDALFLSVLSERMASMIKGVCVASLHTVNTLDLKTMKSLMDSVTSAMGGLHGSS